MTDITPLPPVRSPESDAFWDACAEGRFILRRCAACGEVHWYPRALCPFCLSDRTAWEEASGTGTIYSYTVAGRSDPPDVLAYVQLAEGPMMMTKIVRSDVDRIAVGAPVEIVFLPAQDGAAVPAFRLT